MKIVNQYVLEDNNAMRWNDVLGSKIIGSFEVDDIVKINAENYCKFLNKWFLEALN